MIQWETLAEAAIEPNAFLHPAFALSAAEHFTGRDRPRFLFVGPQQDDTPLSGVFALAPPRPGAGMIARMWLSRQMAMGAPLIDPAAVPETLDAVHDWLARAFPRARGLLFPRIERGGALHEQIHAHARARDLAVLEYEPGASATIDVGPDAATRIEAFMGGKRRKELRRLRRKLAETGALEHRVHAGASAPAAFERFLTLEASGWKGRDGAALVRQPALADFARAMVQRFASTSAVAIHALERHGEPLAMGVVFTGAHSAWYWKTAYDETCAAFSPGALLTQDIASCLLQEPGLKRIYSCAAPDHPMIDRLWPDRVELVDVLVARRGAGRTSFAIAAAAEGARRRLRSIAKAVYNRIRSLRRR